MCITLSHLARRALTIQCVGDGPVGQDYDPGVVSA